jgi:hypothetical protein
MVGGRISTASYEKCLTRQGNDRIPTSFTSLSEARDCLLYNWSKSLDSVAAIRKLEIETFLSSYTEWLHDSRLSLDQFSRAFSDFVESRGNELTEDDKMGAAILRIQECSFFISLHRDWTNKNDLTFCDNFTFVFEKINTLAEGILRHYDNKSSRVPLFPMDFGIVGSLYLVASQCRDPLIRRKSIALLYSAWIQEGVWNSFLAARVAEKVVEAEERGLATVKSCSDVPERFRVFDVYPIYDPVHRRTIVRYSRGEGSELVGRQSFEEVVQW